MTLEMAAIVITDPLRKWPATLSVTATIYIASSAAEISGLLDHLGPSNKDIEYKYNNMITTSGVVMQFGLVSEMQWLISFARNIISP